MSEEDEDAAEVDESEEVVGVALVAHDRRAIVAQPGEQPLHLQPTLVPPQRPAVLRLLPVTAVRRYHLDALFSEFAVGLVGVVRPISDQMLRELIDESALESVSNKGDFVRASTRCVYAER